MRGDLRGGDGLARGLRCLERWLGARASGERKRQLHGAGALRRLFGMRGQLPFVRTKVLRLRTRRQTLLPGGPGLLKATAALALGIASFVAALAPRAALGQLESPRFDLEWNSPPQCPTREAFLGELERALGAADSRRTTGKAQVDIVEDADKGWTATVHTVANGVSGERVLHGETCQTVASAAAVIAAVAIEVPPGAPSASDAPAPSSSNEASAGEVRSEARDRGESQLAVGAAGILDQGTMPSLDFGIEGSLAWALRLASLRLRLGVRGTAFRSEATAAQNPHASEGGTFSLVTGGAHACATKLLGSLEVGPCLGGEVDFMNGSGTGTSPEENPAAWIALDGSALASWSPWRHAGVIVRLDGVLPLARPSFVITRSGESAVFVYRPAPETELIRAGLASLHGGDPVHALALFDRHAREFPGGVLADERDVERITALCDLGRSADARAAASSFLRRRATAPLAGRVLSSCGNPSRSIP